MDETEFKRKLQKWNEGNESPISFLVDCILYFESLEGKPKCGFCTDCLNYQINQEENNISCLQNIKDVSPTFGCILFQQKTKED